MGVGAETGGESRSDFEGCGRDAECLGFVFEVRWMEAVYNWCWSVFEGRCMTSWWKSIRIDDVSCVQGDIVSQDVYPIYLYRIC